MEAHQWACVSMLTRPAPADLSSSLCDTNDTFYSSPMTLEAPKLLLPLFFVCIIWPLTSPNILVKCHSLRPSSLFLLTLGPRTLVCICNFNVSHSLDKCWWSTYYGPVWWGFTVTKLILKKEIPPSASISNKYECIQHTNTWVILAGYLMVVFLWKHIKVADRRSTVCSVVHGGGEGGWGSPGLEDYRSQKKIVFTEEQDNWKQDQRLEF